MVQRIERLSLHLLEAVSNIVDALEVRCRGVWNL